MIESLQDRLSRLNHLPTEATPLHKRILAYLAKLQAHLRDLCSDPAHADLSASGRLARALIAVSGNDKDEVTCYTLAQQGNLRFTNNMVLVRASCDYSNKPSVYEALLGPLIPDAVRDTAAVWASVPKYANGTNETAALDWDVYRLGRTVRHQGALGLSTGLPTLDAALGGGLRGITIIGGPPQTGKSTLALNLAIEALRADADLAVLILSLDQPKTTWYDRLLCYESGLETKTALDGNLSLQVSQDLAAAEERLKCDILPRLRIVDRKTLEDKARPFDETLKVYRYQLAETCGATHILVVVDYFQLLTLPELPEATLDSDALRLRLLQDVQAESRQFLSPDGDPYVLISEVRKGDGAREELTLADLMGSARLGYGADSALLLQAGDAPPDLAAAIPITLHVAKARDGICQPIPLQFDHLRYRFVEARPEQAPKQSAQSSRARTNQSSFANPLAGNRTRI
jgi:hypothetical protein